MINLCILTYIPANTPLTNKGVEYLLNGGINNDDGHGFAIAEPGQSEIIMDHSLDIEQALEKFIEAREKYPNGPALFHSRWATHGSIKLDNCHPFQVNGSNKTVLGHNGILPSDAHPATGDDRSDTRILADDLLPKWFSRLDNRRTRKALAQWAGSYNKLVILTVDPAYRRNIYLVNENAGNWDHETGFWFSNYDYMSSWKNRWTTSVTRTTTHSKPVGTGYSWDWDDYAEVASDDTCKIARKAIEAAKPNSEFEFDADGNELCTFCDGIVHEVTHYCQSCGSCADCYEHLSDCLCYGAEIEKRLKAKADYVQWWKDASDFQWN